MYCTLDDLKKDISETELIQLTDDERTGAVNEDRVNAAAGDAAELIDGFLRGRYALPLNPVPAIIKTIAKEITIYRLYLRRKRQSITQQMTDSYNAQMKLLGQIQKGDVNLGAGEVRSEAEGTPSAGSYKTNKTAEDRVFSKETLDKW